MAKKQLKATTSTARHLLKETCLVALGIKETGDTSQQNSPDHENAKASTPSEPG